MGALELLAADRALPLSGFARLDLLLAADLPDRLSVTFTPAGVPACPPAGAEVRLLAEGRLLFQGRVEESGGRVAGGRAAATFVAHPDWVARARALPAEDEVREVTDSEAAARLADALGLAARIEPTGTVHRRLLRRGDPLRFLLGRARASGRAAAIAAGTLWFAAALRGSRFRDLTPACGVRSLRLSGGPLHRRGSLAVPVLLDGCPLDRLLLQGFGASGDGLYRVSRSRTTWDGGRIWTELQFTESDGDLGGGAVEGERTAAAVGAPA